MRHLAPRDPQSALAPNPRRAGPREDADGMRALAGAADTVSREGAAGAQHWGSLLALQGSAGNRAVAGLMARPVVQRHPGPTENADVEGGGSETAPESATGEATAGEAATGESASGEAATGEAATGESASGEAATGESASGEATPEGATAGESAAEGAEAGSQEASTPDQVITGEASGPDAASGEAGTTTAGGSSQPGTGTTGTTGTTGSFLTGAARRTSIENTCRASATGMWAMRIIEHWGIPVDYEYAGEGSFHRGGSIYINRTLGVGAAALTLMHEAQHAETYKSGRQADRTTLARDEYIRLSIADEAEAVVRQIEGLAITERLWDVSGAGVNDALKQRYLTAFYATRDELHAANPDMSTEEINRRCRIATRDGEVTRWFHDGTFTTSTNHNNYAIFYGNQWDEVHRTPGRS